MKFLVCIVSNANTPELEAMTQACIDSAHLDKCAVVVSERQPVRYRGAVMIEQDEDFNYNRELNKCAQRGLNSPWGITHIAFCNNDLIFTKGWTGITEDMEAHNLASMSPMCPRSHKMKVSNAVTVGYKVGIHFPGWCFVWTTELYRDLGLRENCKFFCADNETVEQLKEANVKHGLTQRIIVEHLGSQTLKGVEDKDELCIKPVIKFNKLYNKNIFNLGE